MSTSLVLTVIGRDRPGLIEALAKVVSAHDGSWVESSMSRLAGRFAGVLHVHVARERADALGAELEAFSGTGLRVTVEHGADDALPEAGVAFELDIVAADRPGIVREVAHAIAATGANIERLETDCEMAPMAGGMLFRASASVRLPVGVDGPDLEAALESLGDDLMVEVHAEGTGAPVGGAERAAG